MFRTSPTLDGDSGAGGGSTTPPDNSDQQDYKKLYENAQARHQKELDAAEKRRAGLQQTYQTEQDAHKTTKTELEQLKSGFATLTSEKDDLQTNFSKLETEKSEYEIELETLRRKEKRAGLIFKKYPELAPFEADGLLPEAEEEKLDETFGLFLEKLGVVKEKGKEEFGKGGTGTPPPAKIPESEGPKALLQQAYASVSKGDLKGYNESYDKYLKAVEKQKS